jgi:hypothetical protein
VLIDGENVDSAAYTAGQTVTLTINPDDEHYIAEGDISCYYTTAGAQEIQLITDSTAVQTGTTATKTFVMPSAAVTLSVTFTANQTPEPEPEEPPVDSETFTISAVTDGPGTVKFNGQDSLTLTAATEVTVTVKPESDLYEIESVTASPANLLTFDSEEVVTDGSWSKTITVSSDAVVSATFVEKTYEVDDEVVGALGDILDAIDPDELTEDDIAEIIDGVQEIASDDSFETTLRAAVQNGDEDGVIDTIAQLEETLGIAADTAKDESLTGSAAELFSDEAMDKVNVIGGGLNRDESGEAVTLKIAAPEQDREVPEQYNTDTAVKFSLDLEHATKDEDGVLPVPVVITLPRPAAFANDSKVTLLHYHNDQLERVPCTDNSDGTISFVMTKFSDVTLVEENSDEQEEEPIVNPTTGFTVTTKKVDNGEVRVTLDANEDGEETIENVAEGTTVYVITTPASKYETDSVSYYVNGEVTEIDIDNDGVYSFKMPGADVTVTAEFGKASSGGSIGGGSTGTTTTTTTTTTTGKTESVSGDNGVTGTVTTDADGNVTAASVTVPVSAVNAANGKAITLPVTVPAASSTDDAPAVTVSVPASAGKVKVEIPVKNVTSGCVAVLVSDNGTETIVTKSTVSDNGVVLTVSGTVTVKVIDNSKSFGDVASSNFFKDYIAFVSSRNLFQGTSANAFNPDGSMTRQALMTVLARLDGQTANSVDEGMAWAKSNGISDGSNPTGSISRQQLATMLYRYAGQPATDGSLSSFSDANGVASYASAALAWAVENGIVTGTTDGKLNPEGTATRAQVAAMVARYVSNIG